MNQPHLLTPQVAEKQFREKFPSEHFSWEDVVRWTGLLQTIMSHRHLLTVHDFEQEGSEELDTVILKALVKACKSHSQEAQDYLDELKLAVAWDRVDIAKSEIFNGDVEWKSRDLEEVMMDALVSNKPEFVRLFVDNGADVADFLTYGRLQQLYRSVAPKSLLFDLLQRKHEEGRLTLAGLGAQQAREPPAGPPAFSLHEVSRVLKDFLHDACRGLYQAERGLARRPSGQKGLLDLNQRSEDPWRDLFLWAVLQNRHEMATYFWAMGQEGVAAALAACKILKEMSHLETEAEVGRTLREAKYEQLALDLFSQCYRHSEERAFALLVRRNRCWSRTTCLHLATEADTKAFFAHDGVQAFLTKIWWGDMASGTPILRLLGAFFCPALIYTNLIAFSKEAPLRTGPEDLQELDSLDTEKSLLCGLGSRAEELSEALRSERDRGRRAAFLLTRWRKFWGAPVTVFLGNVVMYFAFLFLFTYVLLVDFWPPPQGPSGSEVALYFWVFTLVLEEIRQGFFTDEDTHLVKKLTLYVEDSWNKCDLVAIFLFIAGVTCRMLPWAFEAGRTVLAIDFMVFTLRLIHIFAVHKQLGPKIIIVERMMKDVFFFLFFLSVWLVAYGVTTQALLHPHDGRLEWIFRRVLYRPYLQIFGQIPLDEIDEARVNCSLHPLLLEGSPSCPNLYANWVVILLLVTFLLVTNVLLMNLLIAMFRWLPCCLDLSTLRGGGPWFWSPQPRPVQPSRPQGAVASLPSGRAWIRGVTPELGLPSGGLPSGAQGTKEVVRAWQLHVPGGAGQRGRLLEVPALPPHRGVPRAPGTGAPVHPPQPPEPGAQEAPAEGDPAEAGAPGEGPARTAGPEGGHLGGGAEGELPERAGEAPEGEPGGAAAEGGAQGGRRSQVPRGPQGTGETRQASGVSGRLLRGAPLLCGRLAGPWQRQLELSELQQREPTGLC
ncbi:transient receptor potential cation channel subfamily M member 5 isoform X2 [Bos javanicus]|uniref:transient receptor potential cation channel subfamily M member 5 isoform X2 n=1 Tax=Bos javanicus TaxID=9906 RepID=UPI002AA79D0A|nr:transient receptor potential cation channel subfamily M member 5 isoform X2 [Bos javanicus]